MPESAPCQRVVRTDLARRVAHLWLCRGVAPAVVAELAHYCRCYRLAGAVSLYREGEASRALFHLCTGSAKLATITAGGHERILGFRFAPALLGFDDIGERHRSAAVTLEASDVLALPFEPLQRLAAADEALQRNLASAFSDEIVAEQSVIAMLALLNADHRVIAMLLRMPRRAAAAGAQARQVVLPGTRQDLANYLGMRPETLCRTLTRLQACGVVQVRSQTVELLDLRALAAAVGPRFSGAATSRTGASWQARSRPEPIGASRAQPLPRPGIASNQSEPITIGREDGHERRQAAADVG